MTTMWFMRVMLLLMTATTTACCLTPSAFASAEESETPLLAIGQKAPMVTFTDIRFLPRSLDEFQKPKAIVIVFTTLECPVVNRSLPKLKALSEEFEPQGVQFLALNVGVNDSLVEVAQQALEAGLPFPVGKDFDGSAARALGAQRTPATIILDQEMKLRYRGRLDSQVRLGGISAAAARDEFREALTAVLEGKEVPTPEVPVYGCQIEFAALKGLPVPIEGEVTYHEQVAPLLSKYCQDCHRPGTAAPFPLLTYSDAVAHAAMISEVVHQERMPPLFSSRKHGPFSNIRPLTAKERSQIMAWVRQGMKEGDPGKAPPPREFSTSKWKIDTPDLVIRMLTSYTIPESGVIPYRYAILPHVFLQDTWVQQVEILPGNPSVVHHCNLGYARVGEKISATQNFVTGYVPGGDPMILKNQVGFLIPAGSVLGLQLHYVTNGAETTDRTSVGLVFAKEPIQKRLRNIQCVAHRFAIPPGASHYPLTATRTIPCDATGIGLFSHMHLRGKSMVFEKITPDQKTETILSIPNYDFNWQLSYQWPPGAMQFPKGTKIKVTAHYDNSPFNPYNPDPTATVREGEQSFEEMMYGFVFYTDNDEQLNLQINPKTGTVIRSK